MKNSKPKPTAFIFGAGNFGERYLPIVKESYDIMGYLDNNVDLWGGKIKGAEVFSPHVVEQKEFDVIIVAININTDKGLKIYRAIIKQLLFYKVEKSKIICAQKLPKPFNLRWVEMHVVEHCNLNCAGCEHFSNVAEKEFINIKTFEKDLCKLSELTNKDVAEIHLLGGEPLLHPQIIQLIDLTRSYFDKTTRIILLTNGILLPTQSAEFWECAKRNGVVVSISHYPVKLDIVKIRELSVQYSVTVGYGGGTGNLLDIATKPMRKKNYDITGSGDMAENFNSCWVGNNCCISLKKGRLYTCSHVAHSEHFFNKFGFLQKCEEDSIDIYKAGSAEELTTFLSNPIPFCRFCGKTERNLEWKQSKGEISEWT